MSQIRKGGVSRRQRGHKTSLHRIPSNEFLTCRRRPAKHGVVKLNYRKPALHAIQDLPFENNFSGNVLTQTQGNFAFDREIYKATFATIVARFVPHVRS